MIPIWALKKTIFEHHARAVVWIYYNIIWYNIGNDFFNNRTTKIVVGILVGIYVLSAVFSVLTVLKML